VGVLGLQHLSQGVHGGVDVGVGNFLRHRHLLLMWPLYPDTRWLYRAKRLQIVHL
jgi:hypothetical protein